MEKGEIIETNQFLSIQILDCGDIPCEEINNFKEWVIYKGIECGIGKHFEFYAYTENYKDDIPVSFKVFKN